MKITESTKFDFEEKEFADAVIGWLEELQRWYHDAGDTEAIAIAQDEDSFVDSAYDELVDEFELKKYPQEDVEDLIRKIYRRESGNYDLDGSVQADMYYDAMMGD